MENVIPDTAVEPVNLEFLEGDLKLATVYTAFLQPKSQQDAIRLIYKAGRGKGGKAPIIHHPVNWIIDARKKLMARQLLVSTDQRLRNSIIKADIGPIVRSLIGTGAEGGFDPAIIDGVRLVLDSAWFRSFFSYELIHSPITYRNDTVYEPYRDIIKINPSGERLEVTNLKNRLFQLLFEIGYYSHNMRWMLRYVEREQGASPSVQEDPLLDALRASGTFDGLVETCRPHIPPRFVPIYYACLSRPRIRHID